MSFIMEFVENWIRQGMEDPKERDVGWKQRMVENKIKADKNREYWQLPVRAYGYWQTMKYNRVYYYKLDRSNVRGRQDPYDVLQPDLLNHLERPAFLDKYGYPIK